MRVKDQIKQHCPMNPQVVKAALQAWLDSGLLQKEFCKQEGIDSTTLRRWARTYRVATPPRERGRSVQMRFPKSLHDRIRCYTGPGFGAVQDWLRELVEERVRHAATPLAPAPRGGPIVGVHLRLKTGTYAQVEAIAGDAMGAAARWVRDLGAEKVAELERINAPLWTPPKWGE